MERRRLRAARIAAALTAISGLGCGETGGLGQVDVRPDCPPADLVCVVSGVDAPIAVGATLPVQVDVGTLGSAAPTSRLEVADETVLVAEGRSMRGVAPGLSAVLVTTDSGVVLDFIHLWVATPTRIGMRRVGVADDGAADLGERIELLVGDDLAIAVDAFADAQRLAGHGEIIWSTDGDVVTLLEDGRPSYRRLVARNPGTTTVRAEGLSFTANLDIEVLP